MPEQARDDLLKSLGFEDVNFNGVTVQSVAQDGQPGYIYSRQLDPHGRPVSFAFAGECPHPDGESFTFKAPELKKSRNYKLIADCLVYPLFYNTLFYDLRHEMTLAGKAASAKGSGVWAFKPTTATPADSLSIIETASVLYPKLFRRLVDFYRDWGQGAEIDDLPAWMEAKSEKDEVLVLPTQGHTHFDNVVTIATGSVALRYDPWDLVFRSN